MGTVLFYVPIVFSITTSKLFYLKLILFFLRIYRPYDLFYIYIQQVVSTIVWLINNYQNFIVLILINSITIKYIDFITVPVLYLLMF